MFHYLLGERGSAGGQIKPALSTMEEPGLVIWGKTAYQRGHSWRGGGYVNTKCGLLTLNSIDCGILIVLIKGHIYALFQSPPLYLF